MCRIALSTPATSLGSVAIRRAAVAWRPSWSTVTTSATASRLARLPYWLGPIRRAATIWKPYVATFITTIAIAMMPPPSKSLLRRDGGSAAVVTRAEPRGARPKILSRRAPAALRRADSSVVRRWIPLCWVAVLTVVLLGPALAPGYVLVRDMVWVPDLALRPDTLGLGSALPRAVPSDAVVAALDELVPGMLLQKLTLVGSLVGAGAGAAALVRGGLVARLVAVSVTVWSPFVAERMAIGHWPVLLGYAAVPWLAVAGRRAAQGRVPAWMPLVLVVGSLSASAGLVSAAVLLATGLAGGVRRRRTLL